MLPTAISNRTFPVGTPEIEKNPVSSTSTVTERPSAERTVTRHAHAGTTRPTSSCPTTSSSRASAPPSKERSRGSVSVAEVPTFPKYMTSRGHYQLGNWVFIALASGFFLLMVWQHRQVFQLAALVPIIPEGIAKALVDAATNPTAPYLVVVVAIGLIYLLILKFEHPWNVVLVLRDAIYRCISIPQLAGQIFGRAIAIGRVLRQTLLDDPPQRRGSTRVPLRDRTRLFVQHGSQCRGD